MSGLKIWVVYEHPKDWPGCYVARCFEGETPTDAIMVAPEISMLRKWLTDFGLVKLDRHPGDDPVIVETWL